MYVRKQLWYSTDFDSSEIALKRRSQDKRQCLSSGPEALKADTTPPSSSPSSLAFGSANQHAQFAVSGYKPFELKFTDHVSYMVSVGSEKPMPWRWNPEDPFLAKYGHLKKSHESCSTDGRCESGVHVAMA